MKYGRKMVLLDYNSHENQPQQQNINEKSFINTSSVDTSQNLVLSFLDQDMKTILNRTDITDIEKWRLYNEALSRYLFHIRKQQADKTEEANLLKNSIAALQTNVHVHRNIIKPRINRTTVIAKKKRKSHVNINTGEPIASTSTLASVASAAAEPVVFDISSDDSGEYVTPSKRRSFRTLRNRDVSKGTPEIRNKKPSKTSESIFSNWETRNFKHEID